ncbi:MAG: hypothetical protein AAFQ80_05525 [Cyanobacteria bacterium J06621_8]
MTGIPCKSLATKNELQEVKDELQELREQLNAVLGEKEEGGTTQVFKAGVPIVSTATQLAGTAYLGTKLKSASAVQKIIWNDPQFTPILKDLATGKAKWAMVKGSGAVAPLPDLSKLTKEVAKTSISTTTNAKAAAAASSSAALAMFVGNLVASVGLALGNLKITSMFADANQRAVALNNSVHQGLTSYLSKQNSSISQANAQLQQTRSELAEQAQQTAIVNQQLESTQQDVERINKQTKEANQKAKQIETEIAQTKIEIAEFGAEVVENITEIEAVIADTELQVQETKKTIEATNQRVLTIEKEVELVKIQLEEQEQRIVELEDTVRDWTKELKALGLDLQGEIDLTNDRVTLLEGKIIKTQWFVRTRGGGGGSVSASTSAADVQTGLLELASKLTSSEVETPTITTTDIQNQTSTFRDTLGELLPQVQPAEQVNQQQLDNLQEAIKVDTKDAVAAVIGTLLVPDLVDLKNNTSKRRMIDATKSGICESLDGGSCPITSSNPNRTDGLKGLKDTLSSKSDQVSAGLGLANLQANQSILGIVKNTNQVVNHAQHGLQKIQTFAQTAWKAVRGDKIHQGIVTALVVHNAIQLSGNLAQTIGEAASVTLNAIGIKDEEGNAFDINEIVKSKVQSILSSYLGAENYAAMTQRIAKYNRIYQASVNVLDTTTALFDSARTIAEVAANNTGKIGNALRDSGVVYEDAYEEMSEKLNAQNAAMRRLDRFREGLETIESGVSSVSQVSSEVVDIKENFEQLKKEKEDWKKEVDTEIEAKKEEKEESKQAAQVKADISDTDFDPATPAE